MRYLILFFILAQNKLQAQFLSHVWHQSMGGNSQDFAAQMDIDAAGNSYCTGTFKQNLPSGEVSRGGDDIVLFKLNSTGDLLWLRTLGSTGNEQIKDICLDNNGKIWITGSFYQTLWLTTNDTLLSRGASDAFVAQFDTNGNLLSYWQIGGSDFDFANDIAATTDGNLYWTGLFNDLLIIGSDSLYEQGLGDVVLAKFDPQGNAFWTTTLGSPSLDGILNICTSPNGNLIASAYIRSYLILDNDTLVSQGGNDILLLSYHSDGSLQWKKQIGGSGNEAAYGLTTDNAGNVYLAGTFQDTLPLNGQTYLCRGELDGIVLSVDSIGNFRWTNVLTGADTNQPTALQWDNQTQQLYVVGSFDGTMYNGGDTVVCSRHLPFDIFFSVFEDNGDVSWLQSFGYIGNDVSTDFAFDPARNLMFLYGSFDAYMEIGQVEIQGSGGSDMLLLAFSKAPVSVQNIHYQEVLNIYPNPTQDFICIQNQVDMQSYFIYDLQGRCLCSGVANEGCIDVASLPSGQYLISTKTTKTTNNQFFIKL